MWPRQRRPDPGARRCRSGLRAGLLLAAGLLGSAAAMAFDLPQLTALLAQQRSGDATFTEQREVRGLDEPLLSSGTLSFAAPDRFERRTLKPRPESMVVVGNTLTLTRGGRSRSFTLDAAPEMLGAVEAVRATLTGNADVLHRYFKPALAGSADAWTLDLTPLGARAGDALRKVRITGQGGVVHSIEMELLGGDRSVMRIVPVSVAAPGATPGSPPGAAPAAASAR